MDKRIIPHVAYLYHGLRQFTFGVGDNSLTKSLKLPLPNSPFAGELIILLLTLGHVISYDMTDKKSLKTLFYLPQAITDVQNQPLDEMAKSLIKNNHTIYFSFLENGIINAFGDLDEYPADDFLKLIHTIKDLSANSGPSYTSMI